MNSFKRNVPLFAISQAMMMSSMSLIITTIALVGTSIAPSKSLATLPLAILFIAVMLTSIPAAIIMKKIGRKPAYMFATSFGITGGGLATYSIITQQFWLFVFSSILIGIFNGFGNYYRFTAADVVDEEHKSRAISYVMIGGVVAAIVGPNLANYTYQAIADAPFAGSYASIIGLYVLALITLSFLKIPKTEEHHKTDTNVSPRTLPEIIRQPIFIVGIICGMFGYGMMSFIMTATPLAMNHHAHDFGATSFVIQWHVLGMYAPSFFTGTLIQRFGIYNILLLGVLFGAACIVINLMGTSLAHYWWALVFLGISWNFLFIGGTTLVAESYHNSERTKTQALNDFAVFSTVALSSLSAGTLQHLFGWKTVNIASIPILLVIFLSIVWGRLNQSRTHT